MINNIGIPGFLLIFGSPDPIGVPLAYALSILSMPPLVLDLLGLFAGGQ